MLNKENEILLIFAKEPCRKFTFTDIKQISRKKSKSYLALVLSKLVKEEILNKETISRIPIYFLNLNSPKTRTVAGFVLENAGWNKKQVPYKNIQKIMEKIPTQNYVFMITGSYAKNKQTEKSDIDITILVNDSMDVKKIYAELSHACELNIPPIHPYVFKNSEFIVMLTNKEANYGKETFKNNLILYGGQVYLQITDAAVRNGFTGKFVY